MNRSINPAQVSSEIKNNGPEGLGFTDAAITAVSLGSLSVANFLQHYSTEQFIVGGVGVACGAYVMARAVRHLE